MSESRRKPSRPARTANEAVAVERLVVLVVEDDEFDRMTATRLLKRAINHVVVDTADSFDKGLAALTQRDYNIALFDNQLGARSGIELLTEARKNGYTGPMVMLTGSVDPATDQAALEAGAADFLQKDQLDTRNLQRSIRYALDRHRALTSLRLAEQKARFAAEHDALTKLGNRALFMADLEQRLANLRNAADQGFALIYLDLDGFKPINDQFGHAAGDAVLVEVARRLTAQTRSEDLVCRLGGDEFTILADGVDTDDKARTLTHALSTEICQVIEFEGQRLQISASLGVVLSTSEFRSAGELLAYADAAMYASKARGGGAPAFHGREPAEHNDSVGHGASTVAETVAASVEREEGARGQWFEQLICLKSQRLHAVALSHGSTPAPRPGDPTPTDGLSLARRPSTTAEVTGLDFSAIAKWPVHTRLRLQPDHAALTESNNASTLAEQMRIAGFSSARTEIEVSAAKLEVNPGQSFGYLRAWFEAGFRIVLSDLEASQVPLRLLARMPIHGLEATTPPKLEAASSERSTGGRGAEAQRVMGLIAGAARTLELDLHARGIFRPQEATTLVGLGFQVGRGPLYGSPSRFAAGHQQLAELGAQLVQRTPGSTMSSRLGRTG